MASEAQKLALKRYYKKTKDLHKVIILRLNKESDEDVIEKLDEQPNKTEYVRKLVRKDIRG